MMNRLYFLYKSIRYKNSLIVIESLLIFIIILLFFSVSYVLSCLLFTLYLVYKIFFDNLKLDKSKVNLPIIGETIFIKKTFFYDGEFKKFINTTDPSRKPNFYTIKKDTELKVISIKDMDDEWLLFLENDYYRIDIKYFESRDYWETKSDIRANRLKKLGI